MLRAAAKNHDVVAVVVDPADYARVLAELATHGGGSELGTRARLAAQGLRAHRRATTPMVAATWPRQPRATPSFPGDAAAGASRSCRTCATARTRTSGPRFYRDPAARGASVASAHAAAGQGALVQQHRRRRRRARVRARSSHAPACVIVKHANPCGVARRRRRCSSLRDGLPHRSDVGLRRHHRLQPRAGRAPPRAPSSSGSSSRCWSRPTCSREARAGARAQAQRARARTWATLARRGRRGARAAAASTAACWCRTRDAGRPDAEASCRCVDATRQPTAAELRRPALRLARVQVREVQRHRVRARRRHRRRRRRPDEPRVLQRASPP